MDKLIEYLKTHKTHYKLKYIIKTYLNQEVKDVLIRFNLSLYELCYRIHHNIPIDKVFRCERCGKPVGLRGTHGYKRFCDNFCSSKVKANSEEVRIKTCETNKIRYGFENPMQNKEIAAKSLENKLIKNNFDMSASYAKGRETCKRLYGVENYAQTDEFKVRFAATCIEHFGETTNLKTKEHKEHTKRVLMERLGVENPAQSPEIQEKMYQTRKRNGSCRDSKPERECITLLRTKFNVKDHYKSDKYPFECDAYVPELDTYIEFHFYWAHGFEPYDPTNQKHLDKVEKWKQKAAEVNFQGKPKRQYISAIHTWTKLDPLKVETAKKNGLNLLVFYTKEAFIEAFNTLK